MRDLRVRTAARKEEEERTELRSSESRRIIVRIVIKVNKIIVRLRSNGNEREIADG